MTRKSLPIADLTPRMAARAFTGPAGRLLAALIVLIVCEPLINAGPSWSLLSALCWNAVLFLAVYAASPHRRTHVSALILCGLDFVIHPIAAFGFAPGLIHAHSFLVLAMMLYAAVWILHHIFNTTRVTSRTLQEALCVYLLIGMIWTQFFLLIDVAQPGSFRLTAGLTDPHVGYAARRSQTLDLAYYSFVTLSTVGYGDILPVRSLARMTASLEAIVGQVYLAVLIARLVGLQVAQSLVHAEATPPEPGR
jgi:hypothetical protein